MQNRIRSPGITVSDDFQIHIHALGDRAVCDSLDAAEHARKVNDPCRNRHHLAHVQVIGPADVPRFAELDVIVNGQPLWACRGDAMEVLTLPFVSDVARKQQLCSDPCSGPAPA
ncbi:hypothetical protein ACFWAY_42475 [Rhodococcus sp. NPDC059968]|uniref:hypothetical protein n=1 Tax=Rhodococcus sp. NPDC059968 TaxID=3347017 RepID=UPI00366A96E5